MYGFFRMRYSSFKQNEYENLFNKNLISFQDKFDFSVAHYFLSFKSYYNSDLILRWVGVIISFLSWLNLIFWLIILIFFAYKIYGKIFLS